LARSGRAPHRPETPEEKPHAGGHREGGGGRAELEVAGSRPVGDEGEHGQEAEAEMGEEEEEDDRHRRSRVASIARRSGDSLANGSTGSPPRGHLRASR